MGLKKERERDREKLINTQKTLRDIKIFLVESEDLKGTGGRSLFHSNIAVDLMDNCLINPG